MISGGGSNLQAVIDGTESGIIDGRVVFVGSDNPHAGGLNRAERHGIPFFVVDYSKLIRQYQNDPQAFTIPDDADLEEIASRSRIFSPDASPEKIRRFMSTRLAAEAQLLEKMKPYPFDLLILAGFMRNLTPYFIDRVNTSAENPRIMNIHPALLPAFPGTDGYGDTYRYGCKVGGCTVHFVDYGEDTGPIIGQRAFAIGDEDDLETIKSRGLKLEWELYPACIQLFAQNRLKTVQQEYTRKDDRKITRTTVKRLPKK